MFQSVDGNVLQSIGGGVPMSQSVEGNTPMFQSTEGNFPILQPIIPSSQEVPSMVVRQVLKTKDKIKDELYQTMVAHLILFHGKRTGDNGSVYGSVDRNTPIFWSAE